MRTIYNTAGKNPYTGKITQWLGATIPQNYSMIQKIKQIVRDQTKSNITTISIRGREDSGKTELARGMAHLLHTELSKQRIKENTDAYTRDHIRQISVGYIVRVLGVADLKNFRSIIESLPIVNRILIFDDISFKNLTAVKHDITTVRHIKGTDVKTILIYNFHYSKGLDPYLRDTEYMIQTSASMGEKRNLIEAYGNTQYGEAAIKSYIRMYQKIKKNGKLSVNLAPKRQKPAIVNILYSRPFRLALFSNNIDVVPFVFPESKRLGIDKCAVCRATEEKQLLDSNDVIAWLKRRYSSQVIERAFRGLSFLKYGFDVRSGGMSQAAEILLRLEKNNTIDIETLIAAFYGLDVDTVRNSIPKRIKISTKQKDSFFSQFGVDGLRSFRETPRKYEDMQVHTDGDDLVTT